MSEEQHEIEGFQEGLIAYLRQNGIVVYQNTEFSLASRGAAINTMKLYPAVEANRDKILSENSFFFINSKDEGVDSASNYLVVSSNGNYYFMPLWNRREIPENTSLIEKYNRLYFEYLANRLLENSNQAPH